MMPIKENQRRLASMRSRRFDCVVTSACVLLLLVATSATSIAGEASSNEASSAASPAEVDHQRQFFEAKIRPVLVTHCYECHSHESDSIAAEYTLDSAAGMRGEAPDSEPADPPAGSPASTLIVPGDPDASELLLALRYDDDNLQMPPDGPLPAEVVADFEQWVRDGAWDPRDADPAALKAARQSQQAGTHWAFQPIAAPEIPTAADDSWSRTAIDRFVQRQRAERGLAVVPDAGPRELVRRVYFDLIGLPPSIEVVDAFAADPTPANFESIVDDLLASPRFGERWGRHWLDVVRYAESSGMEFNFTYPDAWPYRDYVIASLNADKPYDRFVTEQLAGDLIEPAGERETEGADDGVADNTEVAASESSNRAVDSPVIGTGFLAVGPKRHNAGTAEYGVEMADDQIRTSTEAFLGLTVGCARCHDHKFDPISAADYHALSGIFRSTDVLDGTVKIKYSRHPTGKTPFGPDAVSRHEAFVAHSAIQDKLKTQLTKAEAELKKLQEPKDEKVDKDKKKGKKKKKNEKKDKAEDTGKSDKHDEKVAAQQKKVDSLKEQLTEHEATTPTPPSYAMGAKDGKPVDAAIAIGGDWRNTGETVPRGMLSAIPGPDLEDLQIGEQESGRLQLARWITDPHNPLTARVFVNRVWQHLMGRGIVATVDNFGLLGKPPTHPELLDHLATQFARDGFSIKRMIRSVVLSRSYQLSSDASMATESYAADPDNLYRWRMSPRRLSVEPLRDAMLAAAGTLELTPPEGSPIMNQDQILARSLSAEKLNPVNHHRTVYQTAVRHYASAMLQEFDFAASSMVVGLRAETTTSQQALFLLNSEFVWECAELTAAKVLAQSSSAGSAPVSEVFRRLLSRDPLPREQAAATEFLKVADANLKAQAADAAEREKLSLAALVQTLMGGIEFRYLIHPPHSEPPATTDVVTR